MAASVGILSPTSGSGCLAARSVVLELRSPTGAQPRNDRGPCRQARRPLVDVSNGSLTTSSRHHSSQRRRRPSTVCSSSSLRSLAGSREHHSVVAMRRRRTATNTTLPSSLVAIASSNARRPCGQRWSRRRSAAPSAAASTRTSHIGDGPFPMPFRSRPLTRKPRLAISSADSAHVDGPDQRAVNEQERSTHRSSHHFHGRLQFRARLRGPPPVTAVYRAQGDRPGTVMVGAILGGCFVQPTTDEPDDAAVALPKYVV